MRRFEHQLPDEYRLDVELSELRKRVSVDTHVVDSEHFFTTRTEFAEHFRGKKPFLMESFYRAMRRKHRILLDADGSPVGGQWNFDAENRNKLPRGVSVPPFPTCHSTLIFCGAIGLSRALAGKPFRFPLIGPR